MRLMDASRMASKSTNHLGDKMDGDTDGVMRRGVYVCVCVCVCECEKVECVV